MYVSVIETNRILESLFLSNFDTLNSYLEHNQEDIDNFIIENLDFIFLFHNNMNIQLFNDFETSMLINELTILIDKIKLSKRILLNSKDIKEIRVLKVIESVLYSLEEELAKLSNNESDQIEIILNVVRSTYKLILFYAKEYDVLDKLEKPNKCIHASDLLNFEILDKIDIFTIYKNKVLRDITSSMSCFELFYKFFDIINSRNNTELEKYINSITCRVNDIMDMSACLIKNKEIKI